MSAFPGRHGKGGRLSLRTVVMAVAGHHSMSDRWAMAFTCYADDSGTDPQSTVVTIAGFVASLNDWLIFEKNAKVLFDFYNIEFLHTVDFHHKRGIFVGWSEEKKRKFTFDLSEIIFPLYPVGISVSVDKQRINQRKEDTKLWPNMSPLGCGFVRFVNLIHERVFDDIPQLKELDSAYLSLIVEGGNKNSTELKNTFEKIQNHPNYEKLISIAFCKKRDSYAVQASDFLAFYTRRWMNSCNLAGRKIDKPQLLNIFSQRLTIHSETISDIENIANTRIPLGEGWVRGPRFPKR